MIDSQIATSIIPYIENLYDTNRLFIKISGINYYNCDMGNGIFLKLIHNIAQLIPYKYKNENESITLENGNGLLDFKNDISYIFDDYKDIIKVHCDLLNNIRIVRNKYEHRMHDISFEYNVGGGWNASFVYAYKIKNQDINIKSNQLIHLLKDLNELFSKLVLDIKKYSEENGKKDYKIYSRISRFNFLDFNTIYDSDLLHKIGIIQFDF